MSGFEIAGIVLGSIPLLISAMEHYESSLDRTVAFFKWKGALEAALRGFWYENTLFQMTLRNVLEYIASSAEIEAMMTEPKHALWKSKSIAKSLQQQLGIAYRPYISTIQDMHSCMARLAAHLDVDRQTGTSDELETIIEANKAFESPGTKFFEFKRAVKLTMKRKDIKILLQDMRICNSRLDNFINKPKNLNSNAAPNSTCRKARLSSSLQQIENYAIILHQALEKSKCCSAPNSHDIRLILEDRVVCHQSPRSLVKANIDDRPPEFTISCKSAVSNRPWQLAKIQVIDHDPDGRLAPPKAMSKVAFAVATSPQKLAKKGKQENLSAAFQGRQVAADLYTLFHHLPDPISPLSLCLDDKGVLYQASRATSRPINCTESFIGLRDLLSETAIDNRWKPLTDEDRYRVAIIVASSLLQLHSTPWLSNRWDFLEIRFHIMEVNGQLVIDLRNPFVTEGCVAKSRSKQPSVGTTNHFVFHDNSANLLILANILLQIKLHGRIQSNHQQGQLMQLPALDKLTNFQTLHQWSVQERGNLPFAFHDAIQFCILSSNCYESDLWDVQFRQVLLNKVVMPLVNELQQ